MSSRLISLLENLPPSRVLVLGDFMMDRYIHGNAERLSPEAPVPVLHFQHEEWRLGGAGNVAASLVALHAKPAVVGIVGHDDTGERLREGLMRLGVDVSGLVSCCDRPTTCKTRLVGSAQHRHPQTMLRLDRENPAPAPPEAENALREHLRRRMPECDIFCIEDYNKGAVTQALCRDAIALAAECGKPVIVDPANLPDYTRYAGATCIKLNRTETQRATGILPRTEDQLRAAAETLLSALNAGCVVITLDKDGAYLATREGQRQWLRTRERQVFDVTGAGDLVLAMLAVARAAGADWSEAVVLANLAGGLAVEKFGVVSVTPPEIIQELLTETHEHLGKLRKLEPLLQELHHHRAAGKKIVFTNGCFDILHLGHVKYFQFAKSQGDVLVVGVNTDASIRRLKGEKRPVIAEADRCGVLEELESIDYLILFDEDTPLRLIEAIQPDVLVKGADYTKEQVVGWDIVEKAGGRVALAPLIDGRSTSNVIERILAAYT
ncbi:MAG: D-glycero-beta-D-manno-heptose 1-phosphate adenylyltransferase [Phycisphaerae bacterium]|nr:D-glycero-beta-D-manno-heptose 1-phosphate adenylyltransferase [Phycisphaerae bacterium]MDW8262211.1 D-glycero-beta-D-manno-heptose 1-phosphate adenylyltransferase [Phycisphaerales bacterium]